MPEPGEAGGIKALAAEMFAGRRGHGGGTCTRRVLTLAQLENALRRAYYCGRADERKENARSKEVRLTYGPTAVGHNLVVFKDKFPTTAYTVSFRQIRGMPGFPGTFPTVTSKTPECCTFHDPVGGAVFEVVVRLEKENP